MGSQDNLHVPFECTTERSAVQRGIFWALKIRVCTVWLGETPEGRWEVFAMPSFFWWSVILLLIVVCYPVVRTSTAHWEGRQRVHHHLPGPLCRSRAQVRVGLEKGVGVPRRCRPSSRLCRKVSSW